MNDELQFANPLWLWIGLISCCALIYGFILWNRRRELDLQKLAHRRLLHQLTATFSRKRRWIKQALWIASILFAFIAVARPQYGFEYREVKRRGIDLVFAIDTSRSMLAEDVVPNRLERSQLAITDFVDRLEGDRIGLIPFAGNAFALCPLTLDYSAFRQSLDAIDTDIIPHQGTDLASAVTEANRLFDNEGNNHRILILITDGEDLQGAVASAISAAKEKNMVIHSVGVGDPGGAVIPVSQSNGYQDFIRDENGQIVKTALDETTLRKISDSTGGIYVPLGKGGEGLNQLYREKLRLVPKTEMDQRLDRIPVERYEWPLAVAILLLLIEYMMGEKRRKTGSKSAARRVFHWFKTRRNSTVALVIIALSIRPANAAEIDARQIYNSGTNAYAAGDFEIAEQSLSESLDSSADLKLQQKGYYNLGNTRYRLGQQTLESKPDETIKRWEASVKAYEDALALDATDKDAVFNRDFVKKKLEELKQQQDQQQQDQQQQDQQQQDQQQQDQQQQDQQQQDQQQQDQQQQDQQQQDQQQQDQQQQDQQQQDQQQQDQQQQDQQQQDQQQQDQQQRDQQQQKGEQKTDENGEGEKSEPKRPEKSTGEQPEPSEQPQDPSRLSEERRNTGEMSREEAAQLLEALMKDETTVSPLPDRRTYQRAVPSNTTRGKTW